MLLFFLYFDIFKFRGHENPNNKDMAWYVKEKSEWVRKHFSFLAKGAQIVSSFPIQMIIPCFHSKLKSSA